MFYPERIFSGEEEATIVAAIQAFELRTRAELRVHVENRLRRPALDEAISVFSALKMHQTQERNGVLIFLAPEQRAFAVFGDIGINEVTPDNFWDDTCNRMKPFFSQGKFLEGVLEGIEHAGKALEHFFPLRDGDINELPNDISYG